VMSWRADPVQMRHRSRPVYAWPIKSSDFLSRLCFLLLTQGGFAFTLRLVTSFRVQTLENKKQSLSLRSRS
jgi:hypothetical protein